jgi:Uncharacterized conserved protein (DUF2190)
VSYEIPGFLYSLDAAGDLSAGQFKALVMDTNGRAALAGTKGVPIVGILQNNPGALGRSATIMQSGITKWVASAAIVRNARVTTENDGRAVTAATGNVVHGIALEAAGAAGQVIAVLLTGGGHTAP